MRLRHAALAVLVGALLVSACGGSATPSTSASPSSPGPSPTSGGTPAGSPSGPAPTGAGSGDPSIAPSASVGQTDTSWGRIWDAVPADFPRATGGTEAPPDGPASLTYDAPAGAAAVAVQLQAGMELAGFSTEAASGPLEDGSRVIDSVGDPLECRVQTTIAPLGTTTRVTVLYAAPCPAP